MTAAARQSSTMAIRTTLLMMMMTKVLQQLLAVAPGAANALQNPAAMMIQQVRSSIINVTSATLTAYSPGKAAIAATKLFCSVCPRIETTHNLPDCAALAHEEFVATAARSCGHSLSSTNSTNTTSGSNSSSSSAAIAAAAGGCSIQRLQRSRKQRFNSDNVTGGHSGSCAAVALVGREQSGGWRVTGKASVGSQFLPTSAAGRLGPYSDKMFCGKFRYLK
jgi:hypothetical protein